MIFFTKLNESNFTRRYLGIEKHKIVRCKRFVIDSTLKQTIVSVLIILHASLFYNIMEALYKIAFVT